MIVVLNDRQFGKNLRFLRRRHRYSRWELANLICSYPKVIRDWETGRSFDVDSVCMLNIGKLFGIPIESLIDEVQKMTPAAFQQRGHCLSYEGCT